jgi:hypothetical protein
MLVLRDRAIRSSSLLRQMKIPKVPASKSRSLLVEGITEMGSIMNKTPMIAITVNASYGSSLPLPNDRSSVLLALWATTNGWHIGLTVLFMLVAYDQCLLFPDKMI